MKGEKTKTTTGNIEHGKWDILNSHPKSYDAQIHGYERDMLWIWRGRRFYISKVKY